MTDTAKTQPRQRNRTRFGGATLIRLLIALMAATALALHWTSALRAPAVPAPVHIWWPLLAIGFTASEVWVVHIHFRRDAHSFSLSEVPVVLGLFFTSPLGLVLAQLTGAAVALIVHRRQSREKVLFNLAHFWVEACLAVIVFRGVLGAASPTVGPHEWVAAASATLLTSLVGTLFILAAISISAGRVDLSRLPTTLTQGLVITFTNTSLALTGVTLMWSSRWALWLIAVPLAAIVISYRGYMRERVKHESLEFLYEATRSLQRGDDTQAAVEGLLSQVVGMFRAEEAEIVLFPSTDGDPATAIRFVAGGERATLVAIPDGELGELVEFASRCRTPVLLSPHATVATPKHVAELCTKDGMAVGLTGETRTVGVLIVANHLSEASTFYDSDLRLFETLANHASVALENDRLEAAVRRLRELQDQLSHQAYHDPLTGLANRALLVRSLDARLGAGDPSTLLFVDLDDFKTINDSLGHEAGDALLIEVARRIERCLGQHDIAARLGGDEFAIVLDDPQASRGRPVVAAILEALRPVVSLDGNDVLVHASIGIASSESDHDARDLLCDADVAMYHAKTHGKGRGETFHPDMRAAVRRRHELKADLQRAIERDEFVIHYQPIVELNTARAVGVEALVRWEHPDRGRVAPYEFISLAEETGQIVDIGRIVLREACRQTAEWHLAYGDSDPTLVPLRVNVNLSARQLHEPTLVGDVVAALEDSGLDPDSLSLEITESMFVHDGDLAVARLRDLRSLGVRLAMDDFGTGYSSLGYLRTLPLNAMKVPKPFVDGVDALREDNAIAQAIVTLGRTMNLAIIAEGIERPAQLEALQAMDCELGQGYYFARPLDALGLGKLLQSQRTTSRATRERETRPGRAGEQRPDLTLLTNPTARPA